MPAGTMITPATKVLTVALCDGSIGNHSLRDIVVPLKGKPATTENQGACPFMALGMVMTTPTEPLYLQAALAFTLSLAFVPLPVPCLQVASRMRPPLRAPPAIS